MSTLNVDALVGNTSANAITVRGEGTADLGTGYYQINYNNIFNSINNVPLSHTFNHVDYDTTLTNGKNASLALFYTFKSTNGTLQDSKPFGATFGDLA